LVVQGLFWGMKGAILAIVVEALLRISRRALKNRMMWGLAGLSFTHFAGVVEVISSISMRAPFPSSAAVVYARPTSIIPARNRDRRMCCASSDVATLSQDS
jgi:chromate transport protein ChrA